METTAREGITMASLFECEMLAELRQQELRRELDRCRERAALPHRSVRGTLAGLLIGLAMRLEPAAPVAVAGGRRLAVR